MMYQIFGDSPTIRILDWMLANQTFDHSVAEIADGAGLNTAVTKRSVEPLLNHGVIIVNRTVGRDAMYVLDMSNLCTKAIITFDSKIAECCKYGEDPSEDNDERDSRYLRT